MAKGYKRFGLAMAALLITGYVYVTTGTVEAFFAGLTTLAFDWFFMAHSGNGTAATIA
jgi:hypothetical protein